MTDTSTAPEPVRYRIRPADLHAHLFDVEVEVADPDPAGQRFALPAWIPGSYMIREFARHLSAIEARSGRRRVALAKLDKHTWQAARCRGPLRLRYRVYAWDLSVRGAHLDATHGFFNGTSVFLRALGRDDRECLLEIEAPAGDAHADWRVATTMPAAGAKPWRFGSYRAASYDELIDHPVEIGRFAKIDFAACGVAHAIAITGRHDADATRLARDLAKICEVQIRMFEPVTRAAPFERYLFMTTVVGEGYGGLEHRASTALIAARNDLPWPGMKNTPEGYRRFLGLCSHEYFHSWNVKRIRPRAFARYDLDRENYTRLLWVFEGFTSYYDDLVLARAGVIDTAEYLKALGTTIAQVARGPGRAFQSVAESSFDAWIKYYRQDENSPNTIVSYYAKGALIALCLDLTIRARSKGKRSLDDVMRLMWRRHGAPDAPQPDGLPEDGFAALAEEATGVPIAVEVARWAEGTGELPLSELLDTVGVGFEFRPAEAREAMFGARLATRNGELVVATAYTGGPAQRAGLSAGDAIVAVDGLRADEKGVKAWLDRLRPGDRVAVHAFRRDELHAFEVELGNPPATDVSPKLVAKPGAAKLRARAGWLG